MKLNFIHRALSYTPFERGQRGEACSIFAIAVIINPFDLENNSKKCTFEDLFDRCTKIGAQEKFPPIHITSNKQVWQELKIHGV